MFPSRKRADTEGASMSDVCNTTAEDSVEGRFNRFLTFLSSHEVYLYVRRTLTARLRARGATDQEIADFGYLFTNRWVEGNLIASLLGSIVIFLLAPLGTAGLVLACVIALWGAYRILEILVTQANTVLVVSFARARRGKTLEVKSLQRSLVFLLANCVELMFWFCCVTMALLQLTGEGFVNDWLFLVSSTVFGCLTFDSDQVIGIVSSEDPRHWIRYIALAEATVGSFMSVVAITTFVGSIPGIRNRHADAGQGR